MELQKIEQSIKELQQDIQEITSKEITPRRNRIKYLNALKIELTLFDKQHDWEWLLKAGANNSLQNAKLKKLREKLSDLGIDCLPSCPRETGQWQIVTALNPLKL